MAKAIRIKWLRNPEAHDYPAALSYLSLLFDERTASACVTKLKRAKMSQFKSKDIFRASGLSSVGISNAHIEHDRRKIEAGRALSPLLLVRDPANGKVIIADGYHRLCAVYAFAEDAVIPCRIV
jgi:hypothetical protein